MRIRPPFAIVIPLLLLAGPAGATASRLQALGGEGAYLEDPASVLLWYGSLGDFPDLAVVETGVFKLNGGYRGEGESRISGGTCGGHWSLPRYGTLGLYVHDRFDDGDPAGLVPAQLGHGLTALAGGVLGRAQIGVMLRYGSFSDDWSDTTAGGYLVPSYVPERIVRDNRRLDLGAGVRLDLGERAYLDLAGEQRGARLVEQRLTALEGDFGAVRESNASFALRARGFWRSSDRSALIPHVEYQECKQPLPLAWYGLVPEVDAWQLRTGVGWNYLPDPDRLVLVWYEYLYGEGDTLARSVSPSFAEGSWALKWNAGRVGIGLESRFLPWLTLRCSYRWERRSRSETYYSPLGAWSGLEPVELDGIEHFVRLGAGVHLGRYDLDVSVGEGYPYAPGSQLGTAYFEEARNWLSASARATF